MIPRDERSCPVLDRASSRPPCASGRGPRARRGGSARLSMRVVPAPFFSHTRTSPRARRRRSPRLAAVVERERDVAAVVEGGAQRGGRSPRRRSRAPAPAGSTVRHARTPLSRGAGGAARCGPNRAARAIIASMPRGDENDVDHGARLEAAVHHAVLALRVAALRPVVLPARLSISSRKLSRVAVLASGSRASASRRSSKLGIAQGVQSKSRACPRRNSRKSGDWLKRQRRAPAAREGFGGRASRVRSTRQEVLLVGRLLVGVAGRDHHALDAELVVQRSRRTGAVLLGSSRAKKRGVGGDAEAARERGADRRARTRRRRPLGRPPRRARSRSPSRCTLNERYWHGVKRSSFSSSSSAFVHR